MNQSRKALFQSPHVISSDNNANALMLSNKIELENATQIFRVETEKEMALERLQKIRENIQSLSSDAWLYEDPDKLIGFQRVPNY
ncbi:unnamed protein product [Didymodactylos carnosus]|uniref:Uncharacterized protein n=1 Tax=Didymodactylos carnosus TaxID=1234261 RepID=A0A814KJY9_9BILA|nr:unnamed protein product [Didymodactylos carnosus]CAF1053591.1 unnamed protein product [Didymodactylos carnosus]CAF3591864.1 unnamed protein product [Didymodactylos carnosus]CAF3822849.1 unnamed protein product [Didymodactylos carnosus]